jgi:prolyl-tRNA editing enzyme YbaK/EbsC (Cys-tRNA(Pro) deacylase)
MGFDRKLEVVLDEELAEFETFYCGGGSTRMLLEVKRDDVVRVNNAKVCSITKTQ